MNDKRMNATNMSGHSFTDFSHFNSIIYKRIQVISMFDSGYDSRV